MIDDQIENRRDVHKWDSPHKQKPEGKFRRIRMIGWVIMEVLLMFRWWIWHKRQSMRADRAYVDMHLRRTLQELHFAEERARDQNIEGQVEYIQEARDEIRDVYEELNIQSRESDRYMPYEEIAEFEEEE